NVLAVAGAARERPFILAFGLLLSIAMMGVAANLLGRLIEKYRWIAYLGLAVILYVAFDMIYRGAVELGPAAGAAWLDYSSQNNGVVLGLVMPPQRRGIKQTRVVVLFESRVATGSPPSRAMVITWGVGITPPDTPAAPPDRRAARRRRRSS